MLASLLVRNLALVDEAEVEFQRGLNVITGETGAGKSIIIGSINVALGGKLLRESIRQGADHALVELVFLVENELQERRLAELDVYPEDGQVILSRKISAQGRSVSKINGETVPASLVKTVAGLLIDVHGQHEHQSLLHKRKHLEILDAFAKEELEGPKARMEQLYRQSLELEDRRSELDVDDSVVTRELEFLNFEIEEIQEANLIPGEDEELEEQYRRLTNGGKILEGLGEIGSRMDAGDGSGALELVGGAVREMSRLVDFDGQLEGLQEQLVSIEELLRDFSRDVRAYVEDADFDGERLDSVTRRLDLVNHLKAKHGATIPAVLEALEEKLARRDALLNHNQELEKVREQLAACQTEMEQVAQVISGIRKDYAKGLTAEITDALKDMNFLDVRFDMAFEKKERPNGEGWDACEFLISTNPGSPMLPLGRVASGGELSRVMLAIKTVLAQKDFVDVMIFDEIDVGISGRTAQKISEKMGMLAEDKQIICITHLPQIAAMSDAHFLIEKTTQVEGDEEAGGLVTLTHITALDEPQIHKELARLLGGAAITEAVLENAREMRALAKEKRRERPGGVE